MDSSPDQIIKEIPGFIRLFKDGSFQKLSGTDTVPAGFDTSSRVQSKDIVIPHNTPLSLRIYVPKSHNFHVKKLPLLIYFHGGGFILESAASPVYHSFLNLIAAETNVVIVSVDYRTAPEHPVPACFDDSWEAIKWVADHVNGNGPESWVNEYVDFGRVFFSGDSAGATIAHHMGIRVGTEKDLTRRVNLKGVILLHPFFWGKDRIGSEDLNPMKGLANDVWNFVYPGTSGCDDPLINPAMDPNLSDLGCSKVLVYVGENDMLKDRGWYYKEILSKNGWSGDVEVIEDKGEGHVYFLYNHGLENACNMRKKICTFINNEG
ncbi:hypothetical protein QVD17_19148 [Tagetes erecta]|uniref:Alpha/beta hydrolase fold-3 domain-containing protein n=1 Tax=Tagetes erecta TaxID=13708 RepID=A0AAD8KJ01_TARER|nr:hypothetical protein QVD17_19148 [Tagetes erecta]